MPALKLIDWGEDEDYLLVAIHATSEPYRLAYLVNKHLNLQFYRTSYDQDVTMPDYVAHYPVYKHQDHLYNVDYYMVPNKFYGKLFNTNASVGLFNELQAEEVKVTLIKEYREVDYLIKICTDDPSFGIKPMLASLMAIPQIISAYQVDPLVIKQQDYLTFE